MCVGTTTPIGVDVNGKVDGHRSAKKKTKVGGVSKVPKDPMVIKAVKH
jgi:hypothetical protein